MTARSALRRYLLVSFLTWLPLGLMMAVMVLLMTQRGLSLAQVGLCVTLFSAVTLCLELPTGGLADVAGRRTVLAVSAGFLAAALALMSVAQTVWAFAGVAVLKGVARALSTGPATSWYVDTLHAIEGPDADLKPGLARGGAMESASLCVGVLVGGVLPLVAPGGPVPPLAFSPALGAVAAVALLVVTVFALPEPGGRRPAGARRGVVAGLLRDVPATVTAGLRLVGGRPALRRLMLASAASGVVLCVIELLTPGRLAELAGTAEEGSLAYSVVAALGFAGSAAGSALAPRVARLAAPAAAASARGSVRGAVVGVVVAASSLGALAATAGLGGAAGLAGAGIAYVVLFMGLAVAAVLCQEMTHRAVTAAQRTTVTSTSSLALQSGAIAANLGFGALATQAGTAVAWGAAAVLALASALLFVRMPAPAREPAPVRASSPDPVRPGRSGSD
ncbi:MFS transporter [Nonomuraea pusilla]|uniref:Major Facilitator Superfamily protein n=1 Tax=Nonomuraea pusilla TaxID=46177 RepID=A0A1H8BTP8_9ACTN|nr:MFS transporter [Nonomuraea pusilla]SEM86235.1 Major Facilitator Superfamily protein [Nonomuraea pusilla]